MPSDRPIVIDLFDDVIMGAVNKVRQTFRVALPARVRTYARDQGRAAVDFGVRMLLKNFTTRDEPPAPGLPHITPRGGGYGVYYDLDEGDVALVVACDGPVSGFYDTGQAVTPSTTNGHDYGCAVVLGGGRVSNEETPTPPPNAAGTLLVGADDGTASIVFRGRAKPSPTEQGTVVVQADGPSASLLLGSATAFVPPACEPQVQANLASLNARVQAWVPVPNDGGASLKPIIAAWFAALQDMADAKARLDGPAP